MLQPFMIATQTVLWSWFLNKLFKVRPTSVTLCDIVFNDAFVNPPLTYRLSPLSLRSTTKNNSNINNSATTMTICWTIVFPLIHSLYPKSDKFFENIYEKINCNGWRWQYIADMTVLFYVHCIKSIADMNFEWK